MFPTVFVRRFTRGYRSTAIPDPAKAKSRTQLGSRIRHHLNVWRRMALAKQTSKWILKTYRWWCQCCPLFKRRGSASTFYRALEALLPDLGNRNWVCLCRRWIKWWDFGTLKGPIGSQNPAVHYISFSRNFGKKQPSMRKLTMCDRRSEWWWGCRSPGSPPNHVAGWKTYWIEVRLDCVGTFGEPVGGRTLLS